MMLQNHNLSFCVWLYVDHPGLVPSSSPDPTLCEGKGLVTVEHFVGSCKLSIHCFHASQSDCSSMIFMCYYVLLWSKVNCHVLALTNLQNVALRFCILVVTCTLACDSHAEPCDNYCQETVPMSPDPSSCGDWGLGTRLILFIFEKHNLSLNDLWEEI